MNQDMSEELTGMLRTAVEQVRQATVPEDAVRRAIERSLYAVSSISPTRPRSHIFARVAAGIAFLIGILGVAYWLLSGGGGATFAFADVQEKVQKTRSVTFKLIDEAKGRPTEVERVMILGTNIMRMESPNGQVNIIDWTKQKALFIDPAKKEAMLNLGLPTPELNLYELMRNAAKDPIKRLPEKEVDGRKAIGFVVRIVMGEHEQETTVWVDPKTHLPIRMEMAGKEADGTESRQVLSDMVFDTELEEKLFSLAPPAGYKVKTYGMAELPPAPKEKELLAPEVKPLVGLGPVRFGMSKEEVIRLLGPPDDIPKEGKGNVLSYLSRGFNLMVAPQRGLFWINCVSQKMMAIRVRDFQGRTKEDIGIGSTLKAVEAAYGKPDRLETNGPATKYVSYGKFQLDFTFFFDKVVQFTLQAAPLAPKQ